MQIISKKSISLRVHIPTLQQYETILLSPCRFCSRSCSYRLKGQHRAGSGSVINISDSSFVALPEGGELAIAYTIENPVDGGTLTADPADDWMGEAKVSDTAVVFKVEPNEGEQARETTVTLTYVFGDDRNVTAEVIVSQEVKTDEPDIPDEPEVDPELTITSDPITISSVGGKAQILYKVNNPAEDGKTTAASEAEWLTGFTCDDNNGVVDFTVALNENTEARTATVVLTYTYDGDKTLTAELEVTQEAAEPESEYTFDIQLVAVNADFYGNDYSDYFNWMFILVNEPFNADGSYNSTSYAVTISMNSEAPESLDNLNPPAGDYVYEDSWLPMTIDFMYIEDGTGNYRYPSEVNVNISYEGDNMIFEGFITDTQGATHHVVYNGPVSYNNYSLWNPDTPDEPEVPTDGFNIEATNQTGEYNSHSDDIMSVELVFTDMELDDWGYFVIPGQALRVNAFLPYDPEGNVPAGTYTVTEDAGAINTLAVGNIIDWGGGYFEGEGTYLEVYSEGNWYAESYAVASGTMTVSGSAGNYTVECDFIMEDGTPLTCSYSGPIEIDNIPGPYSILTENYTLDLEGATGQAIFYGDYYNEGESRWQIQLTPADGVGDGMGIELFSNSTELTDGIVSGTYTASSEQYNADPFEYIVGYKMVYYSTLYGTNYLHYPTAGSRYDGGAPATSGDLIVTNNGDGSYTFKFSFQDDKGYTWDGEWSGSLTIQDYSYAPKPPVTDNAPKHRELKVKADPNAKAVTAPAGSIKEYVLKKLGKM